MSDSCPAKRFNSTFMRSLGVCQNTLSAYLSVQNGILVKHFSSCIVPIYCVIKQRKEKDLTFAQYLNNAGLLTQYFTRNRARPDDQNSIYMAFFTKPAIYGELKCVSIHSCLSCQILFYWTLVFMRLDTLSFRSTSVLFNVKSSH